MTKVYITVGAGEQHAERMSIFSPTFSQFRISPVPCLTSGGLTPDVNEYVKYVKYQLSE